MDNTDSYSPRRRMQELLAIPESQRTDEQWDELNELEISLASANRLDSREPSGGGGGGGRRKPPPPQGQGAGQSQPAGPRRPRPKQPRKPRPGGGKPPTPAA